MVNFNHIQDINLRIEKWLESLNNQPIKTTSWDLYKGHYYQILNETLQNLTVEKCIISTGYGILYKNDIVTDYMVTYANHIDEPTKINQLKGVDFRKWHVTLCEKRKVTPLQEWINKDDLVIILLGTDYLNIIKEDLLEVYNKLTNKDNFIIINTSKTNILPNILPIEGKWRKWLGGPQNVMGPNIFKKIIKDNLPLNFTQLNHHFQTIYKPQAEKHFDLLSDEYLTEYIKNNPGLSEGKLLKKLRSENLSCSTGRMKRLYKKDFDTKD
jgi:hypothetical protein